MPISALIANPKSKSHLIFFAVLFLSLSFARLFSWGYHHSDYYFINPALALGIPVSNYHCILLTGFAILALLLLVNKRFNRLTLPAVALVIAGALSNITDRLIWGGTIDYWQILNITSLNFADILICFGLALIVQKASNGQR